ncbi:MAG: hypothetical protein L0Y39_05810 [Methylococcaceae bacterium]|nr:hypothetical protein [Methylococcaceae bacterium]
MYIDAKFHEFAEIGKWFYLALLTFLVIGCVNPAAYREPITRFQQASTIVIEGARIEYGLANKSEREAVIDRLVANRAKINLKTLNDKEIRVLGGDDLAARLSALDALSKHGQLLLTLASSDAPARAKDAANSLDDAIVNLSSSLGNVPADAFKKQAEGFAAIAAEVTKLALEIKISEALDKAIIASEQDVLAFIRLLRNDMSVLHERRRSILSAARVMATDEYNQELAKPNPSSESLRKAALTIKKVEDAWDSLPLLTGAGPGLDAMAHAHQALVEYAKSAKKPQDLAELIETTDAFVTRAKVIADATQTIREAKE